MSREKDLEKIRSVFLSKEIDEETYESNLQTITEWETKLRENESFLEWQSSDVTKLIIQQAKQTYRELTMSLVENRSLTDLKRNLVYNKLDAISWLLSLVNKNYNKEIKTIEEEIAHELQIINS